MFYTKHLVALPAHIYIHSDTWAHGEKIKMMIMMLLAALSAYVSLLNIFKNKTVFYLLPL